MKREYSVPHGPSPAPTPSLFKLLNAVLSSRAVVLVGNWNEQETDFEHEPIYLVRGAVITAFNDCRRPWEELVDQHFGDVDVISGTVPLSTPWCTHDVYHQQL